MKNLFMTVVAVGTGVLMSGCLSFRENHAVSPDGRNEIRYDVSETGTTVQIFRDGKAVTGRCPVALEIAGGRKAKIELTATDEGVAYRWTLDEPGEVTVVSETADLVALAPTQKIWAQPSNRHWKGDPFQISYEHPAESFLVKDATTDRSKLYFAPILFTGDRTAMAVTESDLRDYPGWNFRRADACDLTLKGLFAKFPKKTVNETRGQPPSETKALRYRRVVEREDYLVKTSGSRTFPWRVFMLADSPVALIGNRLVDSLATPNVIGDTSWIRPGKVAWDWWNAWNLQGVDFKAGVNTRTYKYYIDFASKTGVEYVIMDEGWSESLNIWKVIPQIDLPELIRYGKERNVGIILWMAWGQVYGNEEKVAKHFADMGVKGFKVDFMDRDDAASVRFYERFAKACAAQKMLLDYHGAYKPTGLHVTYPNLLNYEGVHGLEQCKWNGRDMIENDASIPFVRGLAGPMDYTPGAMDNYTRETYKPNGKNPGCLGTRVHQMAIMAMFSGGLQMLCDSPTKYERNMECFDFMAKTPNVWDETRGLAGEVGRYCAMARRKGDEWYVAAITDWKAREVEVKLDFLGDGTYTAEAFADAADAATAPTHYTHTTTQVKKGDALKIRLAPAGGYIVRLSK